MLALETAHHGGTQFARQIGVFAQALGYAAPTGIARDVEHGGKGPGDALFTRFGSCHVGTGLDHLRVERGSQSQRNGQYGLVAVNDVAPDDEGDTQPRLLDGRLLYLVNQFRVYVEHRTYLAGPYFGFDRIQRLVETELVHLTYFLFERHFSQQVFDETLLFGVAGRLASCGKQGGNTDDKQSFFHCVCVELSGYKIILQV